MSWNYPWHPNEDPDHITGEDEAGFPVRNRDSHDFLLWFTAMRRKYGYPRDKHVPLWEPRFKDFTPASTNIDYF